MIFTYNEQVEKLTAWKDRHLAGTVRKRFLPIPFFLSGSTPGTAIDPGKRSSRFSASFSGSPGATPGGVIRKL